MHLTRDQVVKAAYPEPRVHHEVVESIYEDHPHLPKDAADHEILTALPHPESQSYEHHHVIVDHYDHDRFDLAPVHHDVYVHQMHELGHNYKVEETSQLGFVDHHGNVHDVAEAEGVHFILEEPVIENARQTFHGRE